MDQEKKDEILADMEEELTFLFRRFDMVHSAFRKKEDKIRRLTKFAMFLFRHKIELGRDTICNKVSILTYELQGIRVVEQDIGENIRDLNKQMFEFEHPKEESDA